LVLFFKKEHPFFRQLPRGAAMTLPRRALLGGAAAGVLARAAPAAATQRRVRLTLEDGVIDMAIFLRQAPLSSGAFLACVDAHAYDGGGITRTVRADNDHGATRIDVIQGGTRPGAGPFPAIAHETTNQTGLRHLDGTVSLPRDTVGTATGAEFFICIGDQPSLDFGGGRNPDRQGFAAFGRVVAGMDVVRAIWRMDAGAPSADAYTAGQMLRHPIHILSARTETA
jgi:peptidyl-prolyl cis-trans isomerase A (cyclophilin A)